MQQVKTSWRGPSFVCLGCSFICTPWSCTATIDTARTFNMLVKVSRQLSHTLKLRHVSTAYCRPSKLLPSTNVMPLHLAIGSYCAGTLPDAGPGAFPALQYLAFQNSQLYGTIPASWGLGSFASLQSLVLTENGCSPFWFQGRLHAESNAGCYQTHA